jgi:DNA (cytosine-5)-methyltransferase 1
VLTFGSLFAGIGGFDGGFTDAGLVSRWAVEIDPDCRRVLAHHWPDVLLLEDVRACGKHNLPPVDVISFGSPCQDLSVAGKRKGMAGERSGLFYEAVRIVSELRPTLAVWENVPGAFSSHAGRDFAQALHALRECGARDICWRVLDARYFGVAQRRRRVFLVADFGGERAAQILLEFPCGCGDSPAGGEAEPSLAPSVTPGARRASGNRAGGQLAFRSSGRGWWDEAGAAQGLGPQGRGVHEATLVNGTIAPTMSSNGDAHSGSRCGHGLVAGGPTARYGKGTDSDATDAIVTHTLRAEGCDAGEDGTGRGTPLVVEAYVSPRILRNQHKKSSNQVGIKDGEASDCLQSDGGGAVAFKESQSGTREADVHATLDANKGSRRQEGVREGMTVRRLTPLECRRLMGFPDDWLDLEPPLSDSVKYRMLGNSVVVPVTKWLGQRIALVLGKESP